MDVNDYWSIDAIIAGQQKMKAIAKSDITGYGELWEEGDEDVKVSQKMNLPLWLAEKLYGLDKIEMYTPKFFLEKYRDTLKADPTIVNLKEKSDYFYETALILGPVLKKENIVAIVPTVLHTYRERLKMILSSSENTSTNVESSTFRRKLWAIEAKLYDANKTRVAEVANFKQQIAVSKNYGVEDSMFKRQTKRVREK